MERRAFLSVLVHNHIFIPVLSENNQIKLVQFEEKTQEVHNLNIFNIWRQKEMSLNKSQPGTMQKNGPRKDSSYICLVEYVPSKSHFLRKIYS